MMEPFNNPDASPAATHPSAVRLIITALVIDMIAYGMMIPVLPGLVQEFVGGDPEAAARYIGWIGAAWALSSFFALPVLSGLSDRFGRRPVILFSLFGLSLDYLAMAWAPSLAWVFAGRILSGAAAATFATSSAYIADITPTDERAARFGLVSVAIGLGYIIGPALGGVLGDVSLRLPFWVACLLTFSNFLFVAIALPESLPQSRRSPFSLLRANPVGAIALYARRPDLATLAGIVFLYYLAGQAVQNVLVPYVDFRFAWSTQMVGLALALLGVGSIAVQGFVVRPFVAKFGERGALCTGLLAAVLGYWIYGLAPSSALFLSAVGLFALSGLVIPGLQGLMSRMVSPMEQGRLQGANMGLLAISSLLGPVLFTEVFARSIGRWAGFVPLGTTWYLAGGLTLAALVLANLSRERVKE